MFQKSYHYIAATAFFISTLASGGVEIGGTRLIYNGSATQAAISVNNPDNKPYLIQSWISKTENGDEGDSEFSTTPPLFKLNSHAQNSVRVILGDNSLPTDRETVQWLNIKAIPTSSPQATNELLIAVKSKMKLFYRPAGLKGDPEKAYQHLKISYDSGTLHIHNPSAYSVSLHELKINDKKRDHPPMILPFQTVSLSQPSVKGGEISWRAINDFGGISAEHKTKM